jgi:hypothetical protein
MAGGNVIYLPKRIGGIGETLNSVGQLGGVLAGRAYDDYNTANVLEEANQIQDPEKKSQFLAKSFHGPEGEAFVKELLDARRTEATIQENRVQMQHLQNLDKLTTLDIANYGRNQSLKEKETNARIAHENALTAGTSAEIALRKAELDRIQRELAHDEEERRNMRPVQDAMRRQAMKRLGIEDDSDTAPGQTSSTDDPFPKWADSTMKGENRPGDPTATNPRSSAGGLGQFTDETWKETVRAIRPDLTAGKTDAQIIAMKTDPALTGLQKEATIALARSNARQLANAGLPVNEGTIKLAHFAGAGGAKALLTAKPETPVERVLSADAIKANPQLAGKTAGEVVSSYGASSGSASAPATSARPRTDAMTTEGVKPIVQQVGSNIGGASEPPPSGQGARPLATDDIAIPPAALPGAKGENAPVVSEVAAKDVTGLIGSTELKDPKLVPTLNQMLFNAPPLDTKKADADYKSVTDQADMLELQASMTFNAQKASVLQERAGKLREQAEKLHRERTRPLPETINPRYEIPGAPGIYARIGTFPDGQTRILGQLIDGRTESKDLVKKSDGLGSWYAQTKAFEGFTEKDVTQPGQDSLFRRFFRGVNAGLVAAGIDPINVKGTDPSFEAQAATVGHNVIAVINLTQGTPRGVRMTEMFQKIIPQITDSPDIRRAKEKASEYMVKVQVKNLVENAIDGRHLVPRNLQEIYDSEGLKDLSRNSMAQEYVRNSVRAGLKPVDLDTGEEIPLPEGYADRIRIPQAEGKPAAKGRGTAPSAPAPAASGWTVEEVK